MPSIRHGTGLGISLESRECTKRLVTAGSWKAGGVHVNKEKQQKHWVKASHVDPGLTEASQLWLNNPGDH